MMNGRLFLGALALCSAGSICPAQSAPGQPPNVVLILADDMGFSDAGCYGGSIVRLTQATFVPLSAQLGESIDTALAEGSEFREVLAMLHAGRHTITVWTYPDSFADFRRINKELYRLGFSAAARPLPPGEYISGSPQGTKSAAQ